jgi:hypothetical protein
MAGNILLVLKQSGRMFCIFKVKRNTAPNDTLFMIIHELCRLFFPFSVNHELISAIIIMSLPKVATATDLYRY